MRIGFWGTYDKSKPRVRILLAGLKQAGCELSEIHSDIWGSIRDKSQLSGMFAGLGILFRILLSWPRLLLAYAFSARQDVVVCAYPGSLDLLVVRALAWLRREKIALDAFLPVYDTVAGDRALLRQRGFAARAIHAFEWVSLRLADIVIVDTWAHGEYFISEFGVDRQKVVRALVGYEPDFFSATPQPPTGNDENAVALFYGQFIPLHGIETIVEAARIFPDRTVRWRIIGTGQEAGRIRAEIAKGGCENVEWIPWVEYEKLRREIDAATVCLGIFGTSPKSGRVIPNKVYQMLACRKPIVTRDSAAIRELFADGSVGLFLVPAGDPAALATAVGEAARLRSKVDYGLEVANAISPAGIGQQLLVDLEKMFSR